MKRLRKIDDTITMVMIWSWVLFLVNLVWGFVLKFTGYSFMMETNSLVLDMNNQMLISWMMNVFWVLAGVVIVCTICDSIVSHLIKVKRARMNRL